VIGFRILTRRRRGAPAGGPHLATLLLPLLLVLGLALASPEAPPKLLPARAVSPADLDVWQQLPRAEKGAGQPLPMWVRALAPTLPHTVAAMLELDYRHRACSPIEPKLRAKLRWVAAHALGCAYGEAYAAADLVRGGGSLADLRRLCGDFAGLPEAEQVALAFARKMARKPHETTDAEVAQLLRHYGEKQVVAMVLLLAYANFQDRLVLALDLPVEPGGPRRPLEVKFAPVPLGANLTRPRKGVPAQPPVPPVRFAANTSRNGLDFPALQEAIEKQRTRRGRIRLPDEPGAIHWGLVCRTYQPELAAAWAACRHHFGAEANQDPVFEASVFWVVSGARESFY
jgi:alkylhydroperoxidase family enzyme